MHLLFSYFHSLVYFLLKSSSFHVLILIIEQKWHRKTVHLFRNLINVSWKAEACLSIWYEQFWNCQQTSLDTLHKCLNHLFWGCYEISVSIVICPGGILLMMFVKGGPIIQPACLIIKIPQIIFSSLLLECEQASRY